MIFREPDGELRKFISEDQAARIVGSKQALQMARQQSYGGNFELLLYTGAKLRTAWAGGEELPYGIYGRNLDGSDVTRILDALEGGAIHLVFDYVLENDEHRRRLP